MFIYPFIVLSICYFSILLFYHSFCHCLSICPSLICSVYWTFSHSIRLFYRSFILLVVLSIVRLFLSFGCLFHLSTSHLFVLSVVSYLIRSVGHLFVLCWSINYSFDLSVVCSFYVGQSIIHSICRSFFFYLLFGHYI